MKKLYYHNTMFYPDATFIMLVAGITVKDYSRFYHCVAVIL